MPLAVGNLIAGRYEVVRAIKSGGMGAVYECRDQRLANSPCALKEILEGALAGPDADYVEDKFKAEVEALVKLDHPGIPKVRDFFRQDKVLYIVMEYVAGLSLDDELADAQRVTGRPLEPEVVAGDTLQVLEILVYLHGRQMLHRDLKPSNLVRDTATGRVKLVDFGLARSYGGQEVMTMVGTPGYSAPEQLTGRAEPRSDLFALGVTMHHLLSGLMPKMLDLQPLKQHMPDYRPGLAAIVEKATRPKVTDRYENAEAMLAALREWCRGEQARRAVVGPETAREVARPEPVPAFVQAPTTVIPRASVPAWVPGIVLGSLGLALGLLLGARPPSIQAASTPAASPLPVAVVAPPRAPSPDAPIRQPDYNVRRPVARPTPAPRQSVPTVQATPKPVARRAPTPELPSQPSYPTAHRRPKPAPTPVPAAPPPVAFQPIGGRPTVLPPGARPVIQPLVAREVLLVDLPPGFTVDWFDPNGVIHPEIPRGGWRVQPRLRVELKADVHCLDVTAPQEQALRDAVQRFSQRLGAMTPIPGLGPDERGAVGTMPNGRQMFVLVKSRREGDLTRLCVLEGGINPQGLENLRQISRGVRLR